jgi:putative hydrolase of the HAD superfamily
MIDTIIFDIGNVLAYFGWREYLTDCGYTEKMINKIAHVTVQNKRWKEWDRGVINEEVLVAESVAREPEVKEEILRFLMEFDQVVSEYDYSERLVKQLKSNGYKIYLLSNFSRRHFQMCSPHFSFLKHVDGGVISSEVKQIKPEPFIHQSLIDKYDITPERAVFLDDLEENLLGAKPFGFHTIQVKGYTQALEELRKLGIRI